MLRASPQHQWALANTLLKIHPTVLNHQWWYIQDDWCSNSIPSCSEINSIIGWFWHLCHVKLCCVPATLSMVFTWAQQQAPWLGLMSCRLVHHKVMTSARECTWNMSHNV
jgi:hypothetical protein